MIIFWDSIKAFYWFVNYFGDKHRQKHYRLQICSKNALLNTHNEIFKVIKPVKLFCEMLQILTSQ